MYRFKYFDLAHVQDKNKNVFHNIYILFYNTSRKCIQWKYNNMYKYNILLYIENIVFYHKYL